LHLSSQLKPYLEAIEREIILFSPYFVPGKAGTKFLTGLVEQGVRVRILTNSLASNDRDQHHAHSAHRIPAQSG
jgi:putative cardiolipin synthase